ncbi:MAG: hypothetical protein IIB36_03660 [Gemmatimonadetes bacterium]|nr:hypothetical protein [Gemmatimonadota bacterium]
MSSYGLTQMLLAARDLLPRVEPDLLIVQYSTWLVDRATQPFAPSYFGLIPVPYFYGDEGIELHGPAFGSLVFDLPVGGYRHSPRSAIDFLSFAWRVGLPLFLHDDYHMLYYYAGRAIGFIPQPTSNRDGMVRHVFSEMARLADSVDASLVIVVLGGGPEPVPIPRHLLPASAVIVDAHQALLEALPVRDRATYDRSYAHWRGEPPRIVDRHPNERAHDIIAGSIVDAVSDSTGAR